MFSGISPTNPDAWPISDADGMVALVLKWKVAVAVGDMVQYLEFWARMGNASQFVSVYDRGRPE